MAESRTTSGRLHGPKARGHAGDGSAQRSPTTGPPDGAPRASAAAAGGISQPKKLLPKSAADKYVGVKFPLYLRGEGEAFKADAQTLSRCAADATRCENWAHQLLLRGDPVDYTSLGAHLRAFVEAKAAGRKPEKYKLPDYKIGTSLYEACKAILDGRWHSMVYNGVSRHVFGVYMKNRWAILLGNRSLNLSDRPRIRIRGSACRVRRVTHPTGEFDRYELCVPLRSGAAPLIVGLGLKGQAGDTIAWLEALATGEHESRPRDGTLVLVEETEAGRRIKRWKWCTSRARAPGEFIRGEVDPDRIAYLHAPADQSCFIRLVDESGRMVERISGDQLAERIERSERRFRAQGANWRQSPGSGAHGHGRLRALQGRRGKRDAHRDWVKTKIGQWASHIVKTATRWRCGRLVVQDFTALDPTKTRMGKFAYCDLLGSLKNRCDASPVQFAKVSFDELPEMLKKREAELTDDQVREAEK